MSMGKQNGGPSSSTRLQPQLTSSSLGLTPSLGAAGDISDIFAGVKVTFNFCFMVFVPFSILFSCFCFAFCLFARVFVPLVTPLTRLAKPRSESVPGSFLEFS